MSKKQPLISFITANWSRLEDTKACVESIKKLNYDNLEIIVVDNGSTDGSKEYFRERDDIVLVDLPENTGFTGGHIAGRKAAKGEYLAIVNNDLVLDSEWATRCLETFARHKDAALVGGKAFKWNADNPPYDVDNEFYSYQEVDPVTGYGRTLLVGEEECSVDSISGAALMIKQAALKKVGYFDDTFFAYYEETDLIARLLRTGWKAYYNPDVHTWHKIAASSSGDSSFYLYQMHRNRYIFGVKNLDEPQLTHFLKNYRREAFVALVRYQRDRNNLDAKCRVRAYRWVRKHEQEILAARAKVQALGGSYTQHLGESERTDVTVVIPCYNYGKYVGEAIDSALNQTLPPKKVIVINDGSTDDSKKAIDAYKKNPLVEIVHKENSGVIDTKNIGVKLSRTYWTVFLDADDQLAPSFLKRTVEMSKNGTKDIVYTDMRLFGAVYDTFRAKPFSTHTLLKANYINNSALIKTSLLKQIGGYKTEMKDGLEDWELYISLVEIGAKPQYLPLALVRYRQHEGALSRNQKSWNHESELIPRLRALHPALYRRHGYYKTVTLHGLKLLAYTVRYPGLIIVMAKAVPSGIKTALGHIYGKGLAYLQKKLGVV